MSVGYQHIPYTIDKDNDYVAQGATHFGLGIDGSLLDEHADETWTLALKGIFWEPMNEIWLYVYLKVDKSPYLTFLSALLNKHLLTAYIKCTTCINIIELYFPNRTIR